MNTKSIEYFFSENLSSHDKQIKLSDEESRHLQKVLRKKTGDIIQITNGNGLLAQAKITDTKSKSIICMIQSAQLIPPSPERKIHITLSTIRPNRMDWAVEKLTELGIGSISFFYSKFTSVSTFKAEHLHKIAISAIKQSRQVYLPQINSPIPFSNWIKSIVKQKNQILLLAHLDNSSDHLEKIRLKKQSTIIAIGPEGGFSDDETKQAKENGFKLIKIDNHILRTETAAVITAAQMKMLLGS